jgi:hypothetical protein
MASRQVGALAPTVGGATSSFRPTDSSHSIGTHDLACASTRVGEMH